MGAPHQAVCKRAPALRSAGHHQAVCWCEPRTWKTNVKHALLIPVQWFIEHPLQALLQPALRQVEPRAKLNFVNLFNGSQRLKTIWGFTSSKHMRRSDETLWHPTLLGFCMLNLSCRIVHQTGNLDCVPPFGSYKSIPCNPKPLDLRN